ncbi:hypothetical protein BaRGS_00016827, partial [Batillaria attramentaria]
RQPRLSQPKIEKASAAYGGLVHDTDTDTTVVNEAERTAERAVSMSSHLLVSSSRASLGNSVLAGWSAGVSGMLLSHLETSDSAGRA